MALRSHRISLRLRWARANNGMNVRLGHNVRHGRSASRKPNRAPGLLDVVVAAVIAFFVFRTFGAVSGSDINPPECLNSSGGVVSCSLTVPVLMLPTFAAVLLGLVAWQVARGRRG